MRKAHELITDELRRTGTTCAFGLPGEDTIEWIAGLGARGIRFLGARHEAAVVAMADGYAWATDSLAICTVTRGPGLLNALTALRTAVADGSKVLLVVGDAPGGVDDPAAHKTLPQRPLCESLGAGYFAAGSIPQILPQLRRATESASQGRAAVLAVAADVLNADASDLAGAPATAAFAGRAEAITWSIPHAELEAIADMLDIAACPLILAGSGADSQLSRAALIELAAVADGLLGTTLLAKGLFDGEPRDLGVVGGYATDAAASWLAQVDLVLAFGASMNRFTRGHGTLFSGVPVIQVDTDPSRFGEGGPTARGLVCDALIAADALRQALARRPAGAQASGPVPAPGQAGAFAGRYRGAPSSPGQPDAARPEGGMDTRDGLHPASVVARLAQLLPEDRVVILDGGRFAAAPARMLAVSAPRGIRQSTAGGAIGLGLGIALGAALGRPDRVTVLFAGDGSISMAISDLETAHRHGIALVMVVMNDRAYGSEAAQLADAKLPQGPADLPEIDFAAVARALGIDARTISTAEDLCGLGENMFRDRSSPLLLDCRISRSEFVGALRWPPPAASIHPTSAQVTTDG